MLTGLDLAMGFFLSLAAFCGILLGLIRVSLVGFTFIAAGTAARLGAPWLAPYLSRYIASDQLRIIAGGVLVVFLVFIMIFFLNIILHKIKRKLKMVWIDRLLGGTLALLVGWTLLALALSLLIRVPVPPLQEALDNSYLRSVILEPLPELFLLEH